MLLITNYFSKNHQTGKGVSSDVIYNILLQIKTIDITILDAFDPTLDNKSVLYLKKFDLVVIDLLDGGYDFGFRCKKFVKNLIQYVKAGGALFSGHDQFDNTHQWGISQEALDMISLLGFKHQNSWGNHGGFTAYFNKKAICSSIFLVNHALYGDSINIAFTHQTYSKFDSSCKTCRVIMKFVKDGSDQDEYLVTNRPNYIGKTLNIRAGHTSSFTEPEKRIFLSSFLWLLYDL